LSHTPILLVPFPSDLDRKGIKLGFVASKKVGRAVQRNRAKRLLKAHFIEQMANLKSGYYILVAKHSILDSNYSKLQKTFFDILKRIKATKQW